MSGLLVSGKIQTLLNRLTAARAAFLDAAISSRASSTALTTLSNDVATVDANVDAIKAVTDTQLDVPLTIVGYAASQGSTSGSMSAAAPGSNVSCGGTINVYTDVINVSGNGVITGLLVEADEALTQNYQFRFIVDGNTVFTSASNFWVSGDGAADGIVLVGVDPGFEGVPDKIRFKTGFSVSVRCTSGSSAKNFSADCIYYTVA